MRYEWSLDAALDGSYTVRRATSPPVEAASYMEAHKRLHASYSATARGWLRHGWSVDVIEDRPDRVVVDASPPAEKKTTPFFLTIETDVMDAMKAYAVAEGTTVTQFVRDAIEEKLANE